MINDLENIIAYWEKCKQREVLAKKCGLFKIQLGCLGRAAQPQENFTVLFSFKLQNNNSTFFFFLHMIDNLIINWVPLFLQETCCAPKTILTIWQNMKSRGFQKSLFPNSLVNREKMHLACLQKNPAFHPSNELGKIEMSS